MLFLRKNPRGQHYLATLTKKHGKAKALTILAHKIARAVYYILSRKQVFHPKKFFGPAEAEANNRAHREVENVASLGA